MAAADHERTAGLHKAACHALSTAELRAMFAAIDANGDGRLDLAELEEAMKKLKLPLGSAAAEVMAEADLNHDGSVDFSEFKKIVRARQELISDLFTLMDANHDEEIGPEEIRAALGSALKLDLSPAEAAAMVKRISPTGDRVSYHSFVQALSLFPAHTQADLIRLWRTSASLSFMLYSDAPRQQSPALILTSGCIAGAVSRTFTAPFDRLSLVLRAGNTVHHGAGLFGALKSMVQKGGVRSLWRGNGINCLQVGPENALTFFFYESLKRYGLRDPEHPTAQQKFGFGALAGAASMTLVYPMYVLQARLAIAEPGVYKGIWDCAKQTTRLEGLRALFKGYAPSLMRIGPYKGSDLLIFNTLKEFLVPPGSNVSVLQSMAFGACAAAFSQSLTYPLVTARTKLQAQGPAQNRPIVYTGALDALRKTLRGDAALGLKAEGLRGVYAGCGANLIKMVPAIALQFTVYEQAVKHLSPYL